MTAEATACDSHRFLPFMEAPTSVVFFRCLYVFPVIFVCARRGRLPGHCPADGQTWDMIRFRLC